MRSIYSATVRSPVDLFAGCPGKTCAACGYSATVRSPVGFSFAWRGQLLPAAPAPPGLIAGVCTVLAGAAAASVASDYHLSGLRARVHGLRRPQIHAIAPLRVHFSLHGLGEYEACQAELLALLALNPSSRGVGQGSHRC